MINLRIQHSNCLWYLFDFLIPCTLSPSQVSLRYNLSSNSLYLHTLPTSKLHQQNRFFFVGHGPDTLACKARPSFDGCGTSLSVSSTSSKDFVETRLEKRIGFRSCSTSRRRSCSTSKRLPTNPTEPKSKSMMEREDPLCAKTRPVRVLRKSIHVSLVTARTPI